MSKKILLVAGHGYGDPGAVGNGTNERDFIRKSIVPNVGKYLKKAGHKVVLYGGAKMDQDLYQDTAYGQRIGNYRDYGMYWVSRQGYDIVVEFHLDASNDKTVDGGHVIVASGLEADSIDKNLQKTLEKHVDALHGISYRDNLLNVNIAKDYNVNYRLVELGFITNKGDMDHIKNNLQAFTKDLADAINGKEIVLDKTKVQTVESKDSKPKATAKPVVKSKPKTYTVKHGDSLWAIGQQFKLNWKDIYKWNHLNTEVVYSGQVLLLEPVEIKKATVVKKQKAPVKSTLSKPLNPIEYLVKKGFNISSDPNTYSSGVWGLRNYTASGYNYDSYCSGYHRAYDLYGATGVGIPAVFDGEVVAGTDSHGNFGGTVVVANEKLGLQVIYGHLRRNLKVKVGDKIKQGQIIGYQGNTNYYNVPMNEHLHIQFQKYEYYEDEVAFVCSGIDIKNVDVTKYPAVNL